jgi:hypothetical protein
VYAVPLLNPVTVIGEEFELPVMLPGLEVATNVAAPFLPRYPAVNDTVAAALPAVADTEVGVSGFLPPASLIPNIGIRRSGLLRVGMYCSLYRLDLLLHSVL